MTEESFYYFSAMFVTSAAVGNLLLAYGMSRPDFSRYGSMVSKLFLTLCFDFIRGNKVKSAGIVKWVDKLTRGSTAKNSIVRTVEDLSKFAIALCLAFYILIIHTVCAALLPYAMPIGFVVVELRNACRGLQGRELI